MAESEEGEEGEEGKSARAVVSERVSEHVSEHVSESGGINAIVHNIQQWHNSVLANDLPIDLRDFLVNSLAAIVKTSMFFETCGPSLPPCFCQLESFSDDDPDPVHIHLYH